MFRPANLARSVGEGLAGEAVPAGKPRHYLACITADFL